MNVLCAAFGIAAIYSKGVLLAVSGMLELGTGCALWGAARLFFSWVSLVNYNRLLAIVDNLWYLKIL